jgi:serine/threonine protein kinase
LTEQTLGDCLGKGAFGSVYRALNWGTGQTVAVKQVRLSDLPKSELRVIMVRLFGGFAFLALFQPVADLGGVTLRPPHSSRLIF